MKEVLLEEVFSLLEEAKRLEKTGCNRIEAATKYYEGCYVMRQILATDAAAAPPLESSDSQKTASTLGSCSRRLLETKIDHYTKVARRMYFDDRSICGERQQKHTPGMQEQHGESSHSAQSQHQCNPQHQPATSVMIELLDDAISVLTTPSVPVSHNNFPPETIPLTHPHLSSQDDSITVRSPAQQNRNEDSRLRSRGVRWNDTNQKQSTQQKQRQQQKRQPQLQQQQQLQNKRESQSHQQKRTQRVTTPELVTLERQIHDRMNFANSRLSRAIDLDERQGRVLAANNKNDDCPAWQWPSPLQFMRTNNPDFNNCRDTTIEEYMEASEWYLKAIQLAENQRNKLRSAATENARQRHGNRSSISLRTMDATLQRVLPKLKRLMISSLDRVEALKKENKRCSTAAVSVAFSNPLGDRKKDRVQERVTKAPHDSLPRAVPVGFARLLPNHNSFRHGDRRTDRVPRPDNRTPRNSLPLAISVSV